MGTPEKKPLVVRSEEVTMYYTSDGAQHVVEQAARDHERWHQVDKYIERHMEAEYTSKERDAARDFIHLHFYAVKEILESEVRILSRGEE